ncbi:MAG TPA: hypothetical protein VFV71_01315 [Burkholderiales bacterium]|nr:hypothetical protein [Burkholderiales bacterium]
MPQQINLYNAAFEPRRELLTFRNAAAGWAVTAALAALCAAYAGVRLNATEQQSRAASQQLAAAQADAQRLAGELAARKHDPHVTEEVARLEEEVRGRHEAMDVLRAGGLGDTRGFSDHLKAFARQSFDGIWLTGLSIATAGRDVALEGRATQAAFVPGYLKKLNGESAMQGHPFSELLIQEPAADPASKGDARRDYVEFRLATKAGPATPKAGGQ